MKIELSEDEVAEILLDKMNAQFQGDFNHVHFDTTYSMIRGVTISREELEKKDV